MSSATGVSSMGVSIEAMGLIFPTHYQDGGSKRQAIDCVVETLKTKKELPEQVRVQSAKLAFDDGEEYEVIAQYELKIIVSRVK
jgi:hypothetical protein